MKSTDFSNKIDQSQSTDYMDTVGTIIDVTDGLASIGGAIVDIGEAISSIDL